MWILRIDLDLAAQAADLHIDAAIEQLTDPPMGEIEQLISAQNALRMLDKGLKLVELT